MLSSVLCRAKLPLGHVGKCAFKNCIKYKLLFNNPVIKNSPSTLSSLFHVSTRTLNDVSTVAGGLTQDEELDKLYKLIEVEVRGNDKAVLRSYSRFTKAAAQHLGLQVGKCWAPEKAHHERFTVLKSIHVNKKNMVQYEFRTHFRFMQFHRMTGSTADTFLEYIQRNLPEGVAMKVTKVGLQQIPDHINPTNLVQENRNRQNIEQVAQ